MTTKKSDQQSSKQKPQQLTLRIPISLHNTLKIEAALEGVPLNQYCIYLLAKGAKG